MAKKDESTVDDKDSTTVSDENVDKTTTETKEETLSLDDALAKISKLEAKASDLEKNRNKAAAKLRQFEKEHEEAEQQALEEQGKWKELAEKQTEQVSKLEARLDQYRVDSVVDGELHKAFSDTNFNTAKKLFDTSSLERDDEGNVVLSSVTSVIEQLKKDHPILATPETKPTPPKVEPGNGDVKGGYIAELKMAKTPREAAAVRAKYGKNY